MRHERQVELLERVLDAGPNLVGLHGPTTMLNDAAVYTDPARFDQEMAVLFRGWPVLSPFRASCVIRATIARRRSQASRSSSSDNRTAGSSRS